MISVENRIPSGYSQLGWLSLITSQYKGLKKLTYASCLIIIIIFVVLLVMLSEDNIYLKYMDVKKS